MSKLSLLDKLKVFFEVSKSTSWIFVIVIVLIILGIVFLKTNKKNEKLSKRIYIAFSLTTLVLVILTYHSPLENIFDYMMNNLFIAIYFPNLAIYFAAIIITNIILWISIFNYKTSDNIKRLNIVIYLLMNYLLVLILNVINNNKLDIFSQESIYKNKQATALIELSSLIFIVWVIFLIVYKAILIYIRKDYKPKVKKVLVRKEVKKLPENFKEVEVPEFIYGNIPHKVKVEETKEEVKEENKEITKIYEDMLTLEDYKLILQLLKNNKKKKDEKSIKEKQINDEMKLEKLQIEMLKQQEKEREENKFTELENLYRSIR